ncbi:unnamed protein product [Closterium sp. NIES-54]
MKRFFRRMFGIRNGRGDVPSSPAPAEGRAPVGTAEPAPAAAEAEAAANLAGAGAGAEAAAAAAAAAATDQAPYRRAAHGHGGVAARAGGQRQWHLAVTLPLWPHLSAFPPSRLLAPRHTSGPDQGGGSAGRAAHGHGGYDIVGFNADAPVDARGLDEAARYIAGILEEERRANPGGWSAVLCCAVLFCAVLCCADWALGSFADGSDASSLSFIASIGLSTWLPNCSLIPGPGGADAAVAERAARHPLFMTHGEGTVWAGRGEGWH